MFFTIQSAVHLLWLCISHIIPMNSTEAHSATKVVHNMTRNLRFARYDWSLGKTRRAIWVSQLIHAGWLQGCGDVCMALR